MSGRIERLGLADAPAEKEKNKAPTDTQIAAAKKRLETQGESTYAFSESVSVDGGWKTFFKCCLIVPALYYVGDAACTAFKNTFYAKTFTNVLADYAKAQSELSATDSDLSVQFTSKEARAAKKCFGEGQKHAAALAGRVVDLTAKLDSTEAKALLEAAKKMISEKLEAVSIDTTTSEKALSKFSANVGEIAVNKYVNKNKLDLKGDVTEQIAKQAEDFVKKGFFASKSEAVSAINTAYARLVQADGEEAIKEKCEKLLKEETVDAAVATRLKDEKADIATLLKDRNLVFNPDKAEDAEPSVAPKRPETRAGREELWYDENYRTQTINGEPVFIDNGSLKTKIEACVTKDKDLVKARAAFEKYAAKNEIAEGITVDGIMKDLDAEKPRDRKSKEILVQLKALADRYETAKTAMTKANEEFTKELKKFDELQEKLNVKAEMVGDLKDPSESAIEDVIRAENQRNVEQLEAWLTCSLPKKGASEDQLNAQLRSIRDVRKEMRDFNHAMEIEAPSDADGEGDDDAAVHAPSRLTRGQVQALKSVDGLLTQVAKQFGYDDAEAVLETLGSGSTEDAERLEDEINQALIRLEGRINARLARLDERSMKPSYIV